MKTSNPLTESGKIYSLLKRFDATHHNHIKTYYLQIKSFLHVKDVRLN